jgi:putative acetyltransferase
MAEIIIANTNMEYEIAALLFKEYAAWLNIDLGFQKFDEELLHLKEMYSFPNGAILLCKSENIFTGCVAVRKKEEGIAELKRMFIKAEYRKKGIGALLLQKALEITKELHYKKIRLDTLDTMTPAINLYKKYGFYEIEPYYFNPEKNALFFEKIMY